ncbi:CGNR zinc finger domain-containing protein [Rhodospira trueperi]|uniref:Conserved protein containing a Zn-ribbon-like motif, possibly RNA-binding n=1 Tax=Rhodospira trueperi TaxID=69960 RepID=A0A1G7HE65_9PROT|nr:CGNR zinc finger domain-containing protein [Rhodospira trueperi]SDE98651.1 Conserved protein containing a Zn-ribbon-like motif, possibly RNA-binding [Rhodospira trueperi]
MQSWELHGLIGGHVVLDFVNTINDELKTRDRNALPDWPAALAWAELAGVLDDAERACLGAPRPDEDTDRELGALIAFRESLWRVLSAVAADRAPEGADLDAVAGTVRWGLDQATLASSDRAFRWTVPVESAGVATVRARLAVAVAEFLERGDLGRLRECGRCTGLYLDHGRGSGRRWCIMEVCGNRAKAERFRKKR